jgi:hypothetical protein
MGMVKQAAEDRARQLAKADGVSDKDFYGSETIFSKYWKKAAEQLQEEWTKKDDVDE